MWKSLSQELKAAVAAVAPGVVHIGGPGIPGRTAWLWKPGLALVLARQAREGETVPWTQGGTTDVATVRAWDRRTGVTLLALNAPPPSWTWAESPTVGELVLTVAHPSPQGVEGRLDLVRFVGGPSEWASGVTLQALVQTDGLAFPGFSGGVIVNADGALAGWVVENRTGNGGFAVTMPDVIALAERLERDGSPRRPWLGVATKPAGGHGLVLLNIEPESPAARAGWQAGDLLVSLAERPLAHPSDLVDVAAGLTPGDSVVARLVRAGQVLERPIVPGAR